MKSIKGFMINKKKNILHNKKSNHVTVESSKHLGIILGAFAIIFLLQVPFIDRCGINDDEQSEADAIKSATISDETDGLFIADFRINDLGVPHGKRYDSSERAIRVMDMVVFDGALYVGGGDYGTNAGPVDMLRYNIAAGEWEQLGSLPDEEVNEFAVIGGVLTVPGTDPRDIGWDKCNYYYLENGEWKMKSTLPGAPHCWDITGYGGKIFAAIQYGGDGSAYYVAVSEDGGESFFVIPLTDENGVPAARSAVGRYYHLLHINGDLYAYCENKLYKYNGERFAFAYDWQGKVTPGNAAGIAKDLGSVVYTDTAMYFSTTALYECADPASPAQLALPSIETVNDLYVFGGELYVLAVERKSAAENIIRVYKFSSGEFSIVAEIVRETSAVCLAVTDDRVYLGLASNNKHADNGRVIEIEIHDKSN